MSNELVSIIIPVYNRAHIINETLDSIQQQIYSNWECIIIDDESTDGIEGIVKEYTNTDFRFKFFKRPSSLQKGASSCRNYGFSLAKGEFVNWFDSDDVMLTDFISSKIRIFESKLEMVISTGFIVDSVLENKKIIPVELKTNLYKDYVLWNLKILTPSILFRKQFLEGKKLFDINIYRGQESEFFSRIFFNLKEVEFKILNKPLFLYRQHEESKTGLHAKSYVRKFMESQSYIALERFKNGLQLKDLDLISYCYKSLLNYLFESIKNNHLKNVIYVLKNVILLIWNRNKILCLRLFFVFAFFSLIKRTSYSEERRLLNKKINC